MGKSMGNSWGYNGGKLGKIVPFFYLQTCKHGEKIMIKWGDIIYNNIYIIYIIYIIILIYIYIGTTVVCHWDMERYGKFVDSLQFTGGLTIVYKASYLGEGFRIDFGTFPMGNPLRLGNRSIDRGGRSFSKSKNGDKMMIPSGNLT